MRRREADCVEEERLALRVRLHALERVADHDRRGLPERAVGADLVVEHDGARDVRDHFERRLARRRVRLRRLVQAGGEDVREVAEPDGKVLSARVLRAQHRRVRKRERVAIVLCLLSKIGTRYNVEKTA